MSAGSNSSPARVIDRLDAELRALWAAPTTPGELPRTRACTRNLVVVGATADAAREWAGFVDDVLQSVPARAIVVALDPDAPDGLEGDVSAACTPADGGGPAICSERIQLLARGEVCARLASCVDALVASDVPTTLVWLGHVHGEDPAFAPLAAAAERIVLDAELGSVSGLAHVLRWAARRPADARPDVADLTWTRLAAWRELCARVFDEPRATPLVWRIDKVKIRQASPAGAPLSAEGALLLGWLATRLGWRARSLAGRLRLVRPQGATVRAELSAAPGAERADGALLGVELEARAEPGPNAGSGTAFVRAVIGRDASDAAAATWRLELNHGGELRTIEQRIPMPRATPAQLLEWTLKRPPHDEALAESAVWADELHGEELACA